MLEHYFHYLSCGIACSVEGFAQWAWVHLIAEKVIKYPSKVISPSNLGVSA
jgi:hypothetical protein